MVMRAAGGRRTGGSRWSVLCRAYGGGGGVSASAVACLVGGQEEGRGMGGGYWDNEMKNLSLPLQRTASTPNQSSPVSIQAAVECVSPFSPG